MVLWLAYIYDGATYKFCQRGKLFCLSSNKLMVLLLLLL